jgi:hypothetical protein
MAMKKFGIQSVLVLFLLIMGTSVWAQDRVLQVHRDGNVVYEVNTSQVDSITFKDGDEELKALLGGDWKLYGLINGQTGESKELEPIGCKQCYTLTFYSEGYGTGYSITNKMIVYPFKKDSFGYILFGKMTLAYDDESGDAGLYYKVIKTITSFSVDAQELKFVYNDQGDYLLYKRVEP